MAETYYDRIKEKEQQIDAYRKRQDADKDLLYLVKYVMTDTAGKKVPDIINVTLNRPAVFAANVIAALGKVTEQVVVETDNKQLDTDYIEDFIRAGFIAANYRLRKKGKPEIEPFFDEQTCIRGGGAARCIFRMENGILVPDITPWDLRYVTWEMSDVGLDYAAYTTTRTKEAILAEYKDLLPKNYSLNNKTATVIDVWDSKHSELWIDSTKVYEQEHKFGYTPVVIQLCSIGSMFTDTDSFEHWGESIFFLIRTVIPELNRLVSIMQTLNLKAVKPPVKQKKIGGGEASEYEDLMGMGATTAMEPSEDVQPIDYGDAKRSAELAYSMFDKAIQEGSLTAFDLGTFTQEMSAIALIEVGEGRDQVFKPRLDTKAILKEELIEMFTNQCMQIGKQVELGKPSFKKSFDLSKLKGSYTTKFRYYPKSPKMDMARFSMAATGKTIGLTQKAIDTEILQREDPDGDERQRRWEEAERISPAIKINRIIKSLLEDAKRGDDDAEFEAETLSAEMGVNLEMMLAGEVTQTPQIEETPKPKTLPIETGRASAKKASNLKMMPQEEE